MSCQAEHHPAVQHGEHDDCVDRVDYKALFEAAPGLYLVLTPDLRIAGASDAYLRATMTERREIVGKEIFTVFPDNPEDPSANGVENLSASLHRVLRSRRSDVLAIQKYDIRRPESEGGGFEERYWNPVNSPVLGADGGVAYIIHHVEDVTELVRLKRHGNDQRRDNDELRDRNEHLKVEIARRTRQLQDIAEREQLANARAHLELSRMRTAAAEERERFRVAFAEASVGMALADVQGRFIGANKAYLKITGYDEEELRTRDFFSITHPDDRPRNLALIEQMIAGQIPAFVIEKRYLKKNGGVVWVQNSVSIARDAGGAPRNLITITEDISERKRAEEERLELFVREQVARADAERANRAKDEFLAMLGHELRNPLAPIVTALHLMQLRADKTTARERSVIERQVSHVIRLVDDLLDVSRITRGKVTLNTERVLLSEVVAKAIEMSSPILEQRRHALKLSIPDHGLTVRGDRVRLAQVVSNLLTNAAKYTEPGGEVSLSVAREGQEVALRVRDTGIGIAPDMARRIFDVFVQERQSLERSRGGLGLGLAIVRNLVTMHGGTVEAHSAGLGKGSEFVVRLPVHSAPAPAAEAAERPGERGRAPLSALHCGSRRILVVDDNVDAAALLADALDALDHVTCIAHDGPSGLEAAATFKPDVALLDIGLPVMDGYEVARRLRALPGLSATRMVAVTGYGQETDRRRSQSAGFDEHFVKPIDVAAVALLIARMTRSAEQQLDVARDDEEPTPA